MAKSRTEADESLVSVIIPVWNTGDRVGVLIKELFGQSYKNIEIIAVDDGSSDDSLRVLQNLAKTDKRLKVIHQENGGVSAARNTGIKIAQGKMVAFIDSDDEVAENFVEEMAEKMKDKLNISLTISGKKYRNLLTKTEELVDCYPQKRRVVNEYFIDYVLRLLLLDGRLHGVAGKMFWNNVIQEKKIRFDESRVFAEDTKFVFSYLAETHGKIECVCEPLYIYNFGTQTSATKKEGANWSHWEKSYQDLNRWVKKECNSKIGLKTKLLLGLVWLKWRIASLRMGRRLAKSTTQS